MDKRHDKTIYFLVTVFLGIGMFFNFNIHVTAAVTTDNKLIINFINTCDEGAAEDIDEHVGKGDAILLQCNGKYALIDGGNAVGKEIHPNLKKALDKLNGKKLQYVISTHPHSDHIGGLLYLPNKYIDKNTVFFTVKYQSKKYGDVSKKVTSSGDQKRMESLLAKIKTLKATCKNIPLDSEQLYTQKLGSSTITIYPPINLKPSSSEMTSTQKTSFVNNTSLIVKVENGEGAALFLGDLTSRGLTSLNTTSSNIHKDILKKNYYELCKIGHHGIRYHENEHDKNNPSAADLAEVDIYCNLNADFYFATTEEYHHISSEMFEDGSEIMTLLSAELNCLYGTLLDKLSDKRVSNFTAGTMFTIMPNGDINRSH